MMETSLSYRDSLFLAETLMPGAHDLERAAAQIRGDEEIAAAMLDDERLFQRLMGDDDVLIRVSPRLFFSVLLRRARRDIELETFSIERRSMQRVVLFDNHKVAELLAQDALREYLGTLLASFTRIESAVIPVRVRKGVWRRYRISEVDVESLIRFCQAVEKPFRFDWYRRIGDSCLFLTSLFPEYIEAQHRYPFSRQPRPRTRGAICGSREDYEAHGRAFFRLAAEHEQARAHGLREVLGSLSEHFILAEKPLAFLSERYLQFTKHQLFVL